MESYQVNQINKDEYGRVSGVFAYNKPANVSSHDIVYKFRRHFETKKVGHAGTLDPFADGLLIVLVGKATKLSDKFLNTDKEYKARILFGIETNSGDPEGDILKSSKENFILDNSKVEEVLNSFKPSYIQSVPLFSSVKLNGKKLRELAREYKGFTLKVVDGKNIAEFYNEPDNILKTIEIPSKEIQIYNIDIVSSGKLSKTEVYNSFKNSFNKKNTIEESMFNLEEYPYIDILVKVSKGTYIRQLAIDIGTKLNIPSMLINLTRTKVGDFSIDQVYDLA